VHILLHGDCLNELKEIPDGAVDMVFADLPYGVTHNRWDTVIPFAPLWDQLLRIGKKNAAFVFTATQPFATALINSQPKIFRYDLVWEKERPTGFLNAGRMPMRKHELVLIFYLFLPFYVPQMIDVGKPSNRPGKRRVYGNGGLSENYGLFKCSIPRRANDRYPSSVIRFNTVKGNQHPTQKPVALLEWLIKTYSHSGDVILDPTMGSGTTGVACANTQRHFIGMEKDATYFETAKKRVDSTYAQAVENGLFDNTGAIVQLDDLKNKIREFETPTNNSEKQIALNMLKGVVTKRALSAMSIQDAVDVLVTVMELPEVKALPANEVITIAELTRKERTPHADKAKKKAKEASAPKFVPSDDDDSDNGEEDSDDEDDE
jgi:site-specific DNA-methyltransferase (adenine-specific)